MLFWFSIGRIIGVLVGYVKGLQKWSPVTMLAVLSIAEGHFYYLVRI